MKSIYFIFLFFPGLFFIQPKLCAEPEYQFTGKHLIISYMDCDPSALSCENKLKEKMVEAAKASGVTVLSSSHHHFEPQGLTQVLLLSESHASIHTYPDFNACFVDLFTCGDSFAMEKFDQILTQYLQPGETSHKLLLRERDSKEIAYNP